jgi:hypothetical protein
MGGAILEGGGGSSKSLGKSDNVGCSTSIRLSSECVSGLMKIESAF